MISIQLKSKDKILVDFDSTIVQGKDEYGVDYYPHIGPLIDGVKEFFQMCNEKGIEIYIWTARTNPIPANCNETQFPIYGTKGIIQVYNFLTKNGLIFKDIYLEYKPIHIADFHYLIDDKAYNSIADFKVAASLILES